MSCNPNVFTVFSPQSPDIRGFYVLKAVRVTAFGLTGNDSVEFKRVEYCSSQPNFQREGCSLFQPTPAQIINAVSYKIGDCAPSLHADRNTIIIPYAGSYLPVVNNTESPDLRVQIEAIEGNQFDDKEKGIEPCGIRCRDTEWTTTGNERCNQHFVEQEEISNCGNVRWIRTEKHCGYYASVPLPITLDEGDCCGSVFMGYLFHPDETRDPDATVEIRDCDKLVGYAYPQAGDGHTLPIEECGGNIIGYAVNNSATAPQQSVYCEQTFVNYSEKDTVLFHSTSSTEEDSRDFFGNKIN